MNDYCDEVILKLANEKYDCKVISGLLTERAFFFMSSSMHSSRHFKLLHLHKILLPFEALADILMDVLANLYWYQILVAATSDIS